VARHAGGRALVAFVPDDCPAPVPAALATVAQALAALDARVVVHVEPGRRSAAARTVGSMLFGAALERPDWLPPPSAPTAWW
jgi:hypothetical protein